MIGSKGLRRIGLGALTISIFLLVSFCWARLFAGGPVSFIPGGNLRGELVVERITDWRFTGSSQYLDVESHARWLPYSTGTWFMVVEGELLILLPRLFGGGLEERLREDPNVRIRIDEKIYPGRVVEEGDASQLTAVLGPLLRRTMSVEIGGTARKVANATPLAHGGIGLYKFESLGHSSDGD